MDSARPFLIPLDKSEKKMSKSLAVRRSSLASCTGWLRRAPGFCVTTWAYEAFVKEHKIIGAIQMELGRKSMDDMRWEEIWDARCGFDHISRPAAVSLLWGRRSRIA